MDNENIKWLTTVPATDGNFISHLRMATDEEIEWSISLMSGKKEMPRELRYCKGN